MTNFFLNLDNLKIDSKTLPLLNTKSEGDSHHEKDMFLKDFSSIKKLSDFALDDNYLKIMLKTITKPNKTLIDIQILKVCLLQVPYINKLVNEIAGQAVTEEMLFNLADNLTYEVFTNKRLLFRTGEKSEKFYIILKGGVSILKPRELKKVLNEDQYKNYLRKLQTNNEIYLLDNILPKNRYIFGEGFEKELSSFKKSRSRRSISYEPFAIENYDPDDYINQFLIPEIEDHGDQLERHISEPIHSRPVPGKQSINKKTRKEVRINEYYLAKCLYAGDIFGDISLNPKLGVRQATAITTEETHVAVIDKKTYDGIAKEIGDKFRKAILNVLMSTFIFRGLDPSRLLVFLGYFYLEKITPGRSLFVEGDQIKEIFFVKKGNFELSKKISILELNKLIFHLTKKEEDRHILEMMEAEKKYKSDDFNRLISDRKKTVIWNYGDYDILGLEDLYDDNRYIFSVDSMKIQGEVYKIELSNFREIIESIDALKIKVKQLVEMKRTHLINKLQEIRTTKLGVYELIHTDESQHLSKSVKIIKKDFTSALMKNEYQPSPIRFLHPEINYRDDNIRINAKKKTRTRNAVSQMEINLNSKHTQTQDQSKEFKLPRIEIFQTKIKVDQKKEDHKTLDLLGEFESRTIRQEIPLEKRVLYKYTTRSISNPLFKTPDKRKLNNIIN